MKTYEELLEAGDGDSARGDFCENAVSTFEGTEDYRNAVIADLYYHKHNVTIENYVKWLYTVSGRKIENIYSANYKLKYPIFRTGVIQHANYLLGKGVIFNDPGVKEKLGKTADHEIIKAVKMAIVEGRSFLFWNNDHLESFGYCCTENHAGFCPIYSEHDGFMKAGIRFRYKRVDTEIIRFYTLYEPEGITEFIKNGDDEVKLVAPRKAYRTKVISTPAEGVLVSADLDYDGALPIVPLYASDTYESELVGIREKIDCYDLLESGYADNVDEASEIYWVCKNAGGMDDESLAKLLQRLHMNHAAQVDGDEGEDLTPHTVEAPHQAREAILDRLRTEIFETWMLVDRKFLSAAQKTEQELQMAYQGQDDYTDDLEYNLMETLDEILRIAGIDSEYHFERNKACNQTERTNMVLAAANYISPECVIRHLPFLTPEEMEDEIAAMQDKQMDQFNGGNDDDTDEEETDAKEETDADTDNAGENANPEPDDKEE